MPRETLYRNRTTGALEAEQVFGGRTLELIYGTIPGRILADLVLKRRVTNQLYGLLQRSSWSRGKIEGFARDLGIDASEAEKPLDGYGSLDEFFCRRLRPGARPIDATADHLVSPADARVLVFPRLDGTLLPVKGVRVDVARLIGDRTLAEAYENGSAIVLRLAPKDYHRFHFPDDGVATPGRALGRALHSVHPIALEAGAPSFANVREVSFLASRSFGDLVLVEVGALCVGTIVQSYAPGPVARGDEKGYFRFGGSTVVVLALRGAVRWDEDLVRSSAEGVETLVKMGTRVGVRA